jgi:hypothetical protein
MMLIMIMPPAEMTRLEARCSADPLRFTCRVALPRVTTPSASFCQDRQLRSLIPQWRHVVSVARKLRRG